MRFKKFFNSLLSYLEFRRYIRVKYFLLGFIVATLINAVVILVISLHDTGDRHIKTNGNLPAEGIKTNEISDCDEGLVWCDSKQKCLDPSQEVCVTSAVVGDDFQDADKAKVIVEQYIKTRPEYVNQQGENLFVKQAEQSQCAGCWKVEASFDVYDSKTDSTMRVRSRLILNNWNVVSFEIRSLAPLMSEDECLRDGSRVVDELIGCGGQGDATFIGDIEDSFNKICCQPVSI